MLRHFWHLVGCAALVALVVGCSGKDTPPKPVPSTVVPPEVKGEEVTGKVTYKGQPVPGGEVHLFGPDGKKALGILKTDGTFKVEGATVGEYKVAIDTEAVKMMIDVINKRPSGPGDTGSKVPGAQLPVYVKIPAKYSKPETSGLTWTIHEGVNKKDFELTD